MSYSNNALKFIDENKKIYIEQFADYWVKFYDYVPNDSDLKKEFKYWLYDYKNIRADYRSKIMKYILNKSFDLIVENLGGINENLQTKI